jgi:endogenous inhibitor of DNA gyrase (YacG/DUF329 family)
MTLPNDPEKREAYLNKLSELKKGKHHPSYKNPAGDCVCKQCGIKFHVKPSRKKAGRGIFHSKECAALWKSQNLSGENSPIFGMKHSDETKQKMSDAKKGENHPNFGKHLSEETKKAIGDPQRGELNHNFGKSPSEETLEKLKIWGMGENNPNFGGVYSKYGVDNHMWKGGPITLICEECGIEYQAQRSHIDRSHFCSKECLSIWQSKNQTGENNPNWKGGREILSCKECGIEYQSQSYEIGRSHFCSRRCLAIWQSKHQTGENAPRWDGGITKLQKLIRGCSKYKEWIKAVFERDDYTDVITGIRGGTLNAHHIISFAELLVKYNIETLEEAINCEALWDIENGITLDRDNHMKLFHSL